MTSANYFFNDKEAELSRQFLEAGYVKGEVEDRESLEKIRKTIVQLVADYLGETISYHSDILNQIHNRVKPSDLNKLRVHIIQKLNDESWLRAEYFKLARSMLEAIVGNELAMQLRVNLSMQLPNDDSSLLPVHADVWSGDSPFEVVVWLPLVNCYGTKSMFLLPPEPARRLNARFDEFWEKSSEELYQEIRSDLSWIEIEYGQVMVFNQNLPHGNRINEESETRWSLNSRFKSVFSPYGDKKLGEFFEPITLRAASRIGMDYQFPVERKRSDE